VGCLAGFLGISQTQNEAPYTTVSGAGMTDAAVNVVRRRWNPRMSTRNCPANVHGGRSYSGREVNCDGRGGVFAPIHNLCVTKFTPLSGANRSISDCLIIESNGEKLRFTRIDEKLTRKVVPRVKLSAK